MGEENLSKCEQEAMMGYWFMLADIITNLNEAYEKAEKLTGEMEECYEGEASEEAAVFLSSLPCHIYRLALFYEKLMEFVVKTAESLFQSDAMMAANMEKQ